MVFGGGIEFYRALLLLGVSKQVVVPPVDGGFADVLMETTSVAFPEGATDADYRQRGHKISAHNAKLMGVPIKIPRKQSIGHHC
jgi:hypothetical protein